MKDLLKKSMVLSIKNKKEKENKKRERLRLHYLVSDFNAYLKR